MDIEKLVTSAVTGYISKTDYLSPFINEVDKESKHGWISRTWCFEQTKNNAEVNTAIYLLLGNIEKARTCYK